ncbi:transcriptional regulator with XRE-family HTH domain [Povalibacter uvarum]|uniref:Transcriptional regulator with XRE-family HTH domain n=1 Tax=Povalibacter uvarum TaxID=732238 RepID=A0A841HQY6_9GAMM|nr:helix-turn-helix transcriptional regulator [Povalibacter uvarum]MBB6095637.1 transcriptional regulator with XRE-family HTH domain [Povalibacter uvarum]
MGELTVEQQALCSVLVEARTNAKLTQRELATRLERDQSVIARVELGERHITLLEFIDYANGVGVEPTKLLAKVIRASKP